MSHKLVVYGTLKQGYGNHICLEGATYLGPVQVESNLYLVDLGPFPAAVPGNSMYNIIGEAYEINDRILQRCDRLEGYPSFYNRSLVETEFGKAWIYHFTDSGNYSESDQITEWKPSRKYA